MLYENIIKVKDYIIARTFNPETNKSEIKTISKPNLPKLFRETKNPTKFKSIIGNKYLEPIPLSKYSDINKTINEYKSKGTSLYGNKSLEQNYIRENFGNSIDNDHKFHVWSLDIETMVDEDDVLMDKRRDWKPMMSNKDRYNRNFKDRSAKAIITSIQIFDTHRKEYFIFGLNKEWKLRPENGKYGKLNYFNCKSEAQLLNNFIKLLRKINPTLIMGWNTIKYDFPYITNRIIRVLDKKQDLYKWSEKKSRWEYNAENLKKGYVQQLSPVNIVTHREVKDSKFGLSEEFTWSLIYLEDYQRLYLKYTYDSLTSYSLESVAQHELDLGKVEHDEFTDFGAFYKGDYRKYDFNKKKKKEDYNILDKLYLELKKSYSKEKEELFKIHTEDTFFRYGETDVNLPYELDNKLKLIDLAKYIAYSCGVNYNNVNGTLQQWNSFVYNEAYKRGLILPAYNQFKQDDTSFLEKAKELDTPRKHFFNRLWETESIMSTVDGKKTKIENYPLRQPRFAGGWTRATGKHWKWVFAMDFTSLYPSTEMWGNIGIESLILPKDLHKDLIDLKARFAIWYPQDVSPNQLDQYDMEFIENAIDNKENAEYIRKILTKHNVTMTPNGVFFKKDKRAVISIIIENLMKDRKKYKKLMFEARDKQSLIELILNPDKEDRDNLKERYKDFYKEIKNKDEETLKNLKFELKQKEDMYSTYEQGIKILINSQYGSLSMEANMFAGHKEYFSTAITSTARIANHLMAREQNKMILKLSGTEAKEIKYGRKSYLDNIAQVDTDSFYGSLEPVIIRKFGKDYEKTKTKQEILDFVLSYIEKVALPLVRDVLDNKYGYTLNAFDSGKLKEDVEYVMDSFGSILSKKYFASIVWKEGQTFDKIKLKVTGLELIRSSTPKYFREKLTPVLEYLIQGNINDVIGYIEEVKKELPNIKPSQLCFNQGVSSVDYIFIENDKKFKAKQSSGKWLTAPINSTASLVYNHFVESNNLNNPLIEGGDKIGFLYMRQPNPLIGNLNVFAFKEESIFEHKDLEKYIDRNTMFEKGFLNPIIKNITEHLNWDLTPKDEIMEDDDW